MRDLIEDNPVTLLLIALTLFVTVTGCVIAIVHPETLTFEQLLDTLEKFALALGVLGVGRGIKANGEKQVQARQLDSLHGDPSDVRTH